MIESLHGDIIQWLRGFYYIAKTGSIRRASEMMNRTPSTLSYGLKSLEAELETVLFDRIGNKLKITPEGEKLMEWTISTFDTLKGMKAELHSASGRLQGQASFSAVLPLAVQLIGTVADFTRDYPDVHLDIRRGMADAVQRNVEDDVSDFGLVSTVDVSESLEFEEVFISRPVLVLPADKDGSVSKTPDMEELKKLPFVSYLADIRSDFGFGNLGDVRAFVENKPVISVNNYHLILQYVVRGLGCAIMDEISVMATLFGKMTGSGLAYRPLDHLMPVVHHGIVKRRRKHLSPQSAELLRRVRQGLEEQKGELVIGQ